MKSSETFAVLLRFTVIALYGIKLALPASIDESLRFHSEISAKNIEEVRRFRESYALRVKSYMNASVDPCDDFYQFACGNYANIIEDLEVNLLRSNTFDILFHLLDIFNQTLHRDRSGDEEHYEELQKVKTFLNSCVNAKLYPIEPQKEYLNFLDRIGGFPALNPLWNASAFEWFKMTSYLIRYGIVGLVEEHIYQVHPFPPYFKVPKFGFGFDIYLDNIGTKNSKGYVYSDKVMRDLLNAYGVAGPKADKVIEDIIEFWREALLAEEAKVVNGYCDSSVEDHFPDWHLIFEIGWGTSDLNVTWLSECPCDWYYNKLDAIAKKRPEAVANYLALIFLYTIHPPHMKSTKFQSQECLMQVWRAFPMLLAHFYIKEHYNQEIEKEILAIAFELRETMLHIAEDTAWLDKPTKQEVLATINSIKFHLGRTAKESFSNTIIKEIHRFNLTDNYASNNLQLARFHVDMKHFFYLSNDLDKDLLPPAVLNTLQIYAGYGPTRNSVNIMAGLLHPPIYHPDFPVSVKYGSLGVIIGHEIGHSVDRPRQWSKESSLLFDERCKCFDQHYNSYSVPEPGINEKINGTLARTENVVDSAAIRQAFAAFRRVSRAAIQNKISSLSQDDTLPGLDLNPEQLFFVSFAQVYCSQYRPMDFWREVSGKHPFDSYRVIGTLQNFEEFPSVYNCPSGSRMNPVKKCRVW